MSGQEWADVLPLIAARVAADTGREVAEVAEALDRAYRATPDELDVDELVELLAPTMAGLVGPVLLDCLGRLESLTREEKMPVLAPLVLGILPGMVAGVVAAERGAGAR